MHAVLLYLLGLVHINPLLLVAILIFVLPCQARSHVEVSNLVGVLTRSRNLDGTSPVEIVVTESISQLLQLDLLHGGLIEWHMHMSGQHTSLSG